MPADLHRARRGGRGLLTLAGAAGVLLGCSRGADGRAADASPGDAGAPRVIVPRPEATPATLLLRRFATDGEAAAKAVAADCGDRAAYLELRKNAAASLSEWRRRLPPAGEVAYGPDVATTEAGGAIGALDRAIRARDCHAARDPAGNLEGAFRITGVALRSSNVPPGSLGQAMSDAAYRLGEAIAESTPYVPEGDDAALADAAGFLAFIDGGVQALGLDLGARDAGATDPLAPLERVRRAHTLADVTDRASVLRATGVLGAAIRRALRAQGIATNLTLTYRPLGGAPDVDAKASHEIEVLTLPKPALPVDPAQAALGKRLFFDRGLSAHGVRACADCHDPKRAYTDGLAVPVSLDPAAPLRRNTPTLLYAPVQAYLMWDGRVRTADRQALGVIHTPAEMGATDDDLARVVADDPSYRAAFEGAFPGAGDAGTSLGAATPANIALALAEFEASALVPGTAPIDRYARGEETALSKDARAGFDVFAGKGRCARCHVPPVFGGSRPPDFTAAIYSVVGVPEAPGGSVASSDAGRGDGAFRVPTVRNVSRTAPYFHHGRYGTLEEVLDFYDRGGGAGLGLAVERQDPDVRPLRLTAEEKRVLLVFLRQALTDAP